MKKQRDLGLNLSTRRTRKAQFLYEMEVVVPWRELVPIQFVIVNRPLKYLRYGRVSASAFA